MNLLSKIKEVLVSNLAVLSLYFLSFCTFEGLKEFPDLVVFSFNLQMIIVYFYVLKFPDHLGYGHIFLGGIINDIVIGTPLGTSSLAYLVLCFWCCLYPKAIAKKHSCTANSCTMPTVY